MYINIFSFCLKRFFEKSDATALVNDLIDYTGNVAII